ncbi:MAG: hypothetical protein WBG50_02885 [Desulfomonilaceae bacterium]
MVFFNDSDGKVRYGTVIASLGIDPKIVTGKYLESLCAEFGCIFEKGELLLWVQATEERADQIFEILRKRYFPFMGKSRNME